MSYENIRLETTGGTVVAWFAPSFEVQPTDQNDLTATPRPRGDPPRVIDNGLWQSEFTVQGAFVHSDDMRDAHRTAVQNEFNQSTVTPTDQINRLRFYTIYSDPQPFNFYHNENEYTAASDTDVNVEDGTYPVAWVQELRTPEQGETNSSRADFLVRMNIGVSRGGEGPSSP